MTTTPTNNSNTTIGSDTLEMIAKKGLSNVSIFADPTPGAAVAVRTAEDIHGDMKRNFSCWLGYNDVERIKVLAQAAEMIFEAFDLSGFKFSAKRSFGHGCDLVHYLHNTKRWGLQRIEDYLLYEILEAAGLDFRNSCWHKMGMPVWAGTCFDSYSGEWKLIHHTGISCFGTRMVGGEYNIDEIVFNVAKKVATYIFRGGNGQFTKGKLKLLASFVYDSTLMHIIEADDIESED